jgi:hypothetical protein
MIVPPFTRARRRLAPGLALGTVLVTGLATAGCTTGAPADGVACSVDSRSLRHPISPYIYGVAWANPSTLAGLGATVDRWGGNGASRYNWVIGAWNAAADWEFRNAGDGQQGGSTSDRAVAGDRSRGVASLITVPALGWVARSADNADRSVDVPAEGGAAVDADGRITGYDPTANRRRTSVPSLPRKPGPFAVDPDPASAVVYQDEWVNHLVARFGRADAGGVRFYAVDNEPMLWSSTHRDVHPAQVGYDDLARIFEEYAPAIKAVDPTALVLGPESWGYSDLLYSAVDRGDDNFATRADRRRHGDIPLIPWFLRTVRQHDAATGRRSLDVLTVHWYPQWQGASDRSDPESAALRLRSTRSLWDPTYVDESWIDDSVRLIPRLRDWVAEDYPGTRLGITEYNFGGGDSISAGLAQAEALGVFGREDLFLATYWTSPRTGSPAGFAFRMYRDADGHGAHFGETSVAAGSSSPGTVSCFASREPGWTDVMLVDKEPDRGRAVTITFAGDHPTGPAQRFQYSGAASAAIVRRPDVAVAEAGSRLQADLPAASITLMRIPTRG